MLHWYMSNGTPLDVYLKDIDTRPVAQGAVYGNKASMQQIQERHGQLPEAHGEAS